MRAEVFGEVPELRSVERISVGTVLGVWCRYEERYHLSTQRE